MISRRKFLIRAGALAASSLFLVRSRPTGTDEEIFRRRIEQAAREKWKEKPLGEIVTAAGTSFLGTPYVAHSLELPGRERLVVNLRAFDCTTFVESTLALARCVKEGRTSMADFMRELRTMRYRRGVIDGYASRLHYFVDWVDDNAAKGIVRDVTEELGGEPYRKQINYMTTHAPAYRQLAAAEVLRAISVREDSVNARTHYVVATAGLAAVEPKIQSGDIVGIATAEAGSDVSHIGIAVRAGGAVHFLHAPLSGGKVELSRRTLAEYVGGSAARTGVIIARPLEPHDKA